MVEDENVGVMFSTYLAARRLLRLPQPTEVRPPPLTSSNLIELGHASTSLLHASIRGGSCRRQALGCEDSLAILLVVGPRGLEGALALASVALPVPVADPVRLAEVLLVPAVHAPVVVPVLVRSVAMETARRLRSPALTASARCSPIHGHAPVSTAGRSLRAPRQQSAVRLRRRRDDRQPFAVARSRSPFSHGRRRSEGDEPRATECHKGRTAWRVQESPQGDYRPRTIGSRRRPR